MIFPFTIFKIHKIQVNNTAIQWLTFAVGGIVTNDASAVGCYYIQIYMSPICSDSIRVGILKATKFTCIRCCSANKPKRKPSNSQSDRNPMISHTLSKTETSSELHTHVLSNAFLLAAYDVSKLFYLQE